MQLAVRLDGEIVSCDSMQVYRGMDIGTAKASAADRQQVPHHLLDILDLEQNFSAKAYRDEADACIRAICQRGKRPILCGGSGLYAKALLYGLNLPPSDERLAQSLRRELADGGREALIEELRQADPASAARVEGNDRRLLRAVEVLRLSQEAPSAQRSCGPPPDYVGPQWILIPSPELNRQRIRRRAEEMFRAGWIDETKALMDAGLLASPTASQALGYAQIVQFLRGEIESLEELQERVVTLTCRYAKRQRTWFRGQHPGANVLEFDDERQAEQLVDEIAAALSPLGTARSPAPSSPAARWGCSGPATCRRRSPPCQSPRRR